MRRIGVIREIVNLLIRRALRVRFIDEGAVLQFGNAACNVL